MNCPLQSLAQSEEGQPLVFPRHFCRVSPRAPRDHLRDARVQARPARPPVPRARVPRGPGPPGTHQRGLLHPHKVSPSQKLLIFTGKFFLCPSQKL